MISEWIFKSPSCFTKGSLHGFHGDIQNECRCSHRGEHIKRGFGVSVEHEVAQYFGITELFRSPPSSIDAFNSRRLSTEWVTKPTLLEIRNTFKDAESVVLLSLLQRSPGMTAVPQKARSASGAPRRTEQGAGRGGHGVRSLCGRPASSPCGRSRPAGPSRSSFLPQYRPKPTLMSPTKRGKTRRCGFTVPVYAYGHSGAREGTARRGRLPRARSPVREAPPHGPAAAGGTASAPP